MTDRNVLGTELEPCGIDPMTGFYRDGSCGTGPEDIGSHTICAVMTAEFLEQQSRIGNDLTTPMPQYMFPSFIIVSTEPNKFCIKKWGRRIVYISPDSIRASSL